MSRMTGQGLPPIGDFPATGAVRGSAGRGRSGTLRRRFLYTHGPPPYRCGQHRVLDGHSHHVQWPQHVSRLRTAGSAAQSRSRGRRTKATNALTEPRSPAASVSTATSNAGSSPPDLCEGFRWPTDHATDIQDNVQWRLIPGLHHPTAEGQRELNRFRWPIPAPTSNELRAEKKKLLYRVFLGCYW